MNYYSLYTYKILCFLADVCVRFAEEQPRPRGKCGSSVI